MFKVHFWLRLIAIFQLFVVKVEYWIPSFLLGLCLVAWQWDKNQQGREEPYVFDPRGLFRSDQLLYLREFSSADGKKCKLRKTKWWRKSSHGIGVAQKERSAHS